MKKNNNPYLNLISEWKVFVVMILIGMLISLGLAEKPQEPGYKSESVIMVEQQYNDQREKRDYYSEENKKLLSSYPVLMTSEDILKKSANVVGYDKPLDELKKTITAEVISDTNCIKLTVNADTPEVAYKLSNEILKETSTSAKQFWKNSKQEVIVKPNELVEESEINKKSVLKKGIVFGVLLFIIYILYIKVIDDRVRRKNDLEEHFDQPVIGVIKKSKKESYDSSNDLAYENIVDNIVYSIPEGKKECKCVALTDFGFSNMKEENTLMIAKRLGESFDKVLLIDCDFDGHSITSMISNNAREGLSEYLTQRTNIDSLIVKNEKSFDFIPSGGRSPHAFKLLDTEKMQFFIEKMKNNYDIIVLNLPTISSVEEEHFVSDNCDGYVVSLEKRRDNYSVMNDILSNRKGIKDNMIGFIFNE